MTNAFFLRVPLGEALYLTTPQSNYQGNGTHLWSVDAFSFLHCLTLGFSFCSGAALERNTDQL